MPEPQGIALSLSNRRPVLKDDPEYNRLLLALRDEQPEALQDDEIAHLQTLSAPNFRTQNDPVADRARLEPAYQSTMADLLGAEQQGPAQVPQMRAPSLRERAWGALESQAESLGSMGRLLGLAGLDPSTFVARAGEESAAVTERNKYSSEQDYADAVMSGQAKGPPLTLGMMPGGPGKNSMGVLTPSRVVIATPTKIPAALGSLANTIKRGSGAAGPYALKAPVLERLRHFYKVGAEMPSSANWESKPAELVDAFGGNQDAAHLWSRLWGATSPNTSVPVNTKESVSALLHYLETGEPMSMAAAQAKDDVGRQVITMAGSKVPNIRNAVAGQPLSGDKVEAMAGFMVGEPRTPIDVHALYGLGSKGDKLGPELGPLRQKMTTLEGLPPRGSLTDTDIYKRYEKALRNTLAEIEPGREVNPIFATTWEGVRTYKGLKPQGGPVDILRAKGLLKPGAMMDPGQLRQALKAAGWSAGAIGALMTGIKQEQP